MPDSSSVSARSPRLHSLDALRGLDMLIILGLDALVLLLASRNPESSFLQEAARQMTHARWEGLHLYDLVFPVFVFISGVSMSFSLGKYTSGNASSAPGLLHLWKRALVLAFLGLLVNGTLTWTDSMRYASVLGLIGFSCAIAGTCILLLAMEPLAQVVESITRISRLAQLDSGLVRPVLKTVAISILTKITAELCKSSGEGGLAAFVETAGTALALAVAAPLAENVLTLMAELLV